MSILLLLGMAVAAFASSSTQIVDAKIEEVTVRGYVLQVGSEHLTVEDTPSTKFWKGKSSIKRDAFGPGDLVTARIKTNVDPPELRELADRDSWKWLDNIRKQPQAGTVSKVDDKYLTLKLADGSEFSYRATDKSKVVLRGQPDARITDLEVGQKVYAKGRTLATLDTWLAEVTDVPIPPKPTKTKGSRKSKPKVLPEHGTIEATVTGHEPQYKMFDILSGIATLHVTYNSHTKFTLNGKPAKPAAIGFGQRARITYSRDKFGRIVASKVELFVR